MRKITGYSERHIRKHLSGFRMLDTQPRADMRDIEAKLRAGGVVEVKEYEIDRDRFDAYRTKINYESAFPKYFKEFGAENVWSRKQLEHFLSFEVTHPRADSVYIDVAASASPVTQILKDHFGVATAYKQDLNYPAGVQGETIGSNACAIPLEDASVDAVIAHNSWEHFEGDSDRGFIVEASRLLKPGGVLCIIPFDLRNEAYQVTSPAIWHSKYKNAPKMPEFDPRAAIVVDDSYKQRLIKYHSPETFVEDVKDLVHMTFTLWIITNSADFRFQRHFITGTKQG